MEEILASIRRIISEDDTATPAEEGAAPAAEAEAATEEPAAAPVAEVAIEAPVAAAPAPEPEAPQPPPAAAADEEDDALELTEKVETMGDLDVFSNDEPAPPPPPRVEPVLAAVAAAPAVAAVVGGLVSDRAATAAAASFGQLSASLAMPRSDRTLEDVVRELLRPMLQQWLDENLAGIVQTAVQAEVERIARAGR